MSDNVNVSYSFQIESSAPAKSSAPDSGADTIYYACSDCEQLPLNDNNVLLVNQRNNKRMVVTREVARALVSCNTFESLCDHATALCALIPALRDQQADVLQVLESARGAGILTDSNEVAARLTKAPDSREIPASRVFVITCDRPRAIERLLESILGGEDLERHDQLVLIDDSRDPENASRNRQLVGDFNRRSGKSMLYFGCDAAASLLDELIAALPAQEAALRFLLDRTLWQGQPTYGVSRNLALLLSVGCRAIVLDDDILCRAVRPPQAQAGIGFSYEESRQTWFYQSPEQMLQQVQWHQSDPLQLQTDALGKPLAQLLLESAGGVLEPAALAHVDATMLGVLSGSSPVLILQCGSAGHPGTVGSRWVAKLSGASLQRLLASSDDTSSVPDSSVCWLGYTRTTVSVLGVMSQMTGLDNSYLLPPYAPVLRGEDDLFACMTAYLHPDSAVWNCDWAVPHLPIDDRADATASKPFTPRLGLGNLSAFVRSRIDLQSRASANTRLSALAAQIRGIGEGPPAVLLARCDMALAHDCAATVRKLEARMVATRNLDHAGWQQFLRRFAADAQAALTSTATVDSHQVPPWVGELQAAALSFAAALDTWPAIRDHSRAAADRLFAAGTLLP